MLSPGPLSQRDKPCSRLPGPVGRLPEPGPLEAVAGNCWVVSVSEGLSVTPVLHFWGTLRHLPPGICTGWQSVFKLTLVLGSVFIQETAPDSVLSLFTLCRILCSSSRGGNPGLACAEWGMNSTGSMGTRLSRTRELRLHLLATERRAGGAQPPGHLPRENHLVLC